MPQRPLETGLRLAVAGAGFLALAHFFGRDFLEAILPLFRWELGVIDDHFRILNLGLAVQGADPVLRLDVTLQRPLVVGGHLILPDPRGHATVTTLAGSALQPLIVLLALLLAWPVRGHREILFRATCAPALALLLLMADLPFVLAGELWAILVDRFALGSFSPLLAWKDFLQGGGRTAMACATGGLALTVSHIAGGEVLRPS